MKNTKIEDSSSNYYIDWLENSILNNHIKYYKYSDFKNKEQIGFGTFAVVHRVNWNFDVYALKTFRDQNSLKGIVNELILHRKVNYPNIIKFVGVTKEETDKVPEYSLVLEYADSGTLKTYLNKHFNELEWNDKLKLALQLAKAVSYLHEKDIIHRDLHASNILVHQKTVKLSDFGLSKDNSEESNIASDYEDSSKEPKMGVLPYMDPNNYFDKNYRLNKKSDVYSIGVLMWQISSGCQPFRQFCLDNVASKTALAIAIKEGKREKIVDGTPTKYSNLYTKCWKTEHEERPNASEVVSTLQLIKTIRKEKIENYSEVTDSSKNLQSDSEEADTSYNPHIDDIVLESTLTHDTDSTEYESYSTIMSNETIELSTEFFKLRINHINNIIKFIIREHDKGITFDQIQKLICQQLLHLTTDYKIIDWLKKQVEAQYIWFLGLFYFYNIYINKTSEAFKLFSKASEYNFPLAQVYLAKCYSDGYGTEQNKYLAFKSYEESAKNKSIAGRYYLGCFYEFGIGIERDEEKAFYWYGQAANYDNVTAKLCLANCYRLGKGVKKDKIEAFNYYKILAKQRIPDAQYQLGYCYHNGIGTEKNKKLANYWFEKAKKNGNIVANNVLNKYQKINPFFNILELNIIGKLLIKVRYNKEFYYFQKAAKNGNKVAQYHLANCYRTGNGVKKDLRKAYELYKESAEHCIDGKFQLAICLSEGIGTDINKAIAIKLYKIVAHEGISEAQNNLGNLYLNGDCIKKNPRKAVELFKKAAKNGDKIAQYNLGRCYGDGICVEKDEKKAFELYKKSFKQGNLDAQNAVAYYYDNGIGTEQNKKKAFKLYKNAAKKGNKLAQNNIGILYERGDEVNKDLKKAFNWYNEAAKNGNETALYNLGVCYEKGIGTKENNKEAFEFYKKSAERGYIKAQCRVAYCFDRGIGTNEDKKAAFELYKEAAERGNKIAQNNLGTFYEEGKGTEKNLRMAFYWYYKAAEDGNETAQYNLRRCYEYGIIGIEKNEVIFEFSKSVKHGCINSTQYRAVYYCYDQGIRTEINIENSFISYTN